MPRLHHTIQPRHACRYQVFATYLQSCIEVMLALQVQWTKLWRANELNLILKLGVSTKWCNLDGWLTILQCFVSSIRRTGQSGWSLRLFWSGSICKLRYFKASQPEEALYIKIFEPTYPGGRCLLKGQFSCSWVSRFERWSAGDLTIFGLATPTKSLLY